MLPREGLPDILLGLEALHELDDLQVGGIDLRVLGQVVVLLRIQDSLLEEVLADLPAVLLGDDHGERPEAGTVDDGGGGAERAREGAILPW